MIVDGKTNGINPLKIFDFSGGGYQKDQLGFAFIALFASHPH